MEDGQADTQRFWCRKCEFLHAKHISGLSSRHQWQLLSVHVHGWLSAVNCPAHRGGDVDVGDCETGDREVGDAVLVGDTEVGEAVDGETEVGDALDGDSDVGEAVDGETEVGDALDGVADVVEAEVAAGSIDADEKEVDAVVKGSALTQV